MKRPVRTHDAPLSVANRRGRIRIRSVYGAPTDVVARRATAHLARERSTIERASERASERATRSVRFDRSIDRSTEDSDSDSDSNLIFIRRD
jgi:hypothetical protein